MTVLIYYLIVVNKSSINVYSYKQPTKKIGCEILLDCVPTRLITTEELQAIVLLP